MSVARLIVLAPFPWGRGKKVDKIVHEGLTVSFIPIRFEALGLISFYLHRDDEPSVPHATSATRPRFAGGRGLPIFESSFVFRRKSPGI